MKKRISAVFLLLLMTVGVCTADTAINIFVIWNDAGNIEGIRPESLDVKVIGSSGDVETEIAPDIDQHWKATVNINGDITGLTVDDAAGYTRREPFIEENTVTLIYDRIPIVVSRTAGNMLRVEVNVNKTWAGVPTEYTRQPGVDIVLLADGIVKERRALGPQGTVKFENLPLYADTTSVNPISYIIKEELTGNWIKISDTEWISLDGLAKYTAGVSQNGREWMLTSTFSWMQDKLAIPVEKIWKDEEDRPASITLGLFTDIDSDIPLQTVELTASGNWKGKFDELPIRDALGKRIDYSSCVVKEKMGDSWIENGGMIQLDGKIYRYKE